MDSQLAKCREELRREEKKKASFASASPQR